MGLPVETQLDKITGGRHQKTLMQNLSTHDPGATTPTCSNRKADSGSNLIYVVVLIGGTLSVGEHITLAPVAGFVLIVTGILIVARGIQKA